MYKNFFKRIIDFSLSLVGFIVLLPIYLVVYIILYFLNDGKPLFVQPRPGKDEKVFNILKFKTMTDGRDEKGELLPDDERVTKAGTFFRKSSLDEIPQLINVIKGDMSLVGPRPLRVRYLEYYTKREKIRHTVRPGITGLAQVSGRNSLTWDAKLEKDAEYVENLSFFLDLKILLRTVEKVFKASGINPESDTRALDEIRSEENVKPQIDIIKESIL